MFFRALLLSLLIAAPAAAEPYKAPRTPDGAPDLDGEWTNASFTRLQRPRGFKTLTPTDEEAAAWIAEQRNRLVGITPPKKPGEPEPPPEPNFVGGPEGEWYEMDGVGLARIDGQLRSSWIVDPTDGRLPYNTLGQSAVNAGLLADDTDFSGPEARIGDERCLMALGSVTGPPMLNSAQNSRYKIVQTPTEIAILVEMIHDVRIIRIGAKHDAKRRHHWMGDSVGWWEGDTLVVETIDQHPVSAHRFVPGGILHITPAAKITERFTRIADDTLRYDFVVDDPAVFTGPWRAEMVMKTTDAPMYEYACHEGNYSLPNILRGARTQEREAAEKATK